MKKKDRRKNERDGMKLLKKQKRHHSVRKD